MDKNGKSDSDLHKDHRKRLRKRFIDEGLEGFYDHQILELLLFYSIPRIDTNGIAHNLLEHFGSLSAVFEADYDSLLMCEGIGENTAVLIKMIAPLARAYLMDKETRYPHFSDLTKLGSYLVNYFVGQTRERLVAVFLTSKMEMIDVAVISNGTVISSDSSARKIAEIGFSKNASFIVLAHNHPGGEAVPSKEDISLTNEYAMLFHKLGMPLIDHFVIAGSSYSTIYSCRNDKKDI